MENIKDNKTGLVQYESQWSVGAINGVLMFNAEFKLAIY